MPTFQITRRRLFLGFVLLMAAAPTLLSYGCRRTYRYRWTVFVSINGVLKSGSTVFEMTIFPNGMGYNRYVKGISPVISVGRDMILIPFVEGGTTVLPESSRATYRSEGAGLRGFVTIAYESNLSDVPWQESTQRYFEAMGSKETKILMPDAARPIFGVASINHLDALDDIKAIGADELSTFVGGNASYVKMVLEPVSFWTSSGNDDETGATELLEAIPHEMRLQKLGSRTVSKYNFVFDG